ncbi:hypothetical protein [Aquabacter cavernae]|uniref:hypothetical protein n=1 Tax=Aquabacter cavernae TaxID=2496029 RepID=UPI000F8EC66D|nr:hypothetical protein [Aquabacter cavernae]
MNARWPLNLALGIVLVCGVALKLGIGHQAAPDAQPGTPAAVTSFLERQGLAVTGMEADLDLTLIQALAPPRCHMTVALMAPQGWHGGVLASLAVPGTPPFFVFDGKVHDAQPAARARARLYWTLLLRQLGIHAAFHPLLGVIAEPACRARDLPWQDVAVIAPPDQPGMAARK